ncbi:MAG TPA: hypothetical protein VNN77_08135 [candidate division Zixibacteria bacterium]|nr:hypothetical protein [candidate division Zixibacteria bacterium]
MNRAVFALLSLWVAAWGCAGSVDHDGELARRAGEEFAAAVFVERDFDKGYSLLADGARRYVTREKFREVISRLHPGSFPGSVVATDYEPMHGEKALYLYLIGEAPEEKFYYRLVMEGSAGGTYRPVAVYRSDGPYPPSPDRKKLPARSQAHP